MDIINQGIMNMTIGYEDPQEINEFDPNDEDDVFLILNEKDKQYALENNLKIAYSNIDLEDGDDREDDRSQVPKRKNRLCASGPGCSNVDCNLLHSLHDLVLFPCKDQHLCCNAIYRSDLGYFINIGSGCFNVHGNERRVDFFIRNGLVNLRPGYVEPVKLEGYKFHRRSDEEKGIMFRPRRITVKPDEQVIKTLVCQSIKKKLKCKFGDSCTFAHRYSEVKVISCKLRQCTGHRGEEPCPYIHTNETRLQFDLRNQFYRYFPDDVQPPLPEEQVQQFVVQQQDRRKTKLCSNIENCRFGSRCNFAHSLQELRK